MVKASRRDLPAWGYLLLGALAVAGGVALLIIDPDWNRLKGEASPYLLLLAGAAAVVKAVIEWRRNGSPTGRRLKSDEEMEREETRTKWYLRAQFMRMAIVVVAVAVVGLLAALGAF